MSEAEVLHELKLIIPEFLGLLVSYVLIGSFWIRHHRLFNYIHHYSPRLISINFIFLFTIILYPFSTSFLFNSYLERIMSKTQVIIYLLNPLLSSVALLALLHFTESNIILSEKGKANLNRFRLVATCLSFLVAIAYVIIAPKQYATFCFFFLAIPKIISRVRDRKNLSEKNKQPQSQN